MAEEIKEWVKPEASIDILAELTKLRMAMDNAPVSTPLEIENFREIADRFWNMLIEVSLHSPVGPFEILSIVEQTISKREEL